MVIADPDPRERLVSHSIACGARLWEQWVDLCGARHQSASAGIRMLIAREIARDREHFRWPERGLGRSTQD